MTPLLTWISHNFWLVFWIAVLFGGSILEFLSEKFNVGLGGMRRRVKAKRKHQLQLKRLELEIAREQAAAVKKELTRPQSKKPTPGPCVHRNVKAVISKFPEEKLLGWLCTACDTQLPADWAVREEDL